ncbi:MAG: molybdenum cofactor biosynthesis protein B [Alphaproteobacteria bacterium]
MPLDLTRDFIPLNIAIATISDTRTLEDDISGNLLVKRVLDAGHSPIDRSIIKDDIDAIIAWFNAKIDDDDTDIVITTGGTGLTGRDSTPEALSAVITKEIPGFGEYFRAISATKIASSTIQSRAMAGVANGTYLFCLPGSPGACKDGWDEILSHQLDNRFRPCNFVELIPRLNEK